MAAAYRSALLKTIIAYLLFILLGQFTVHLVFGPEFAVIYGIAVVMLCPMCHGHGAYMISTYNLRAYLVGMIATVALNIGLSFPLVPNWGINGALAANILSYLVAGGTATLVFISRTGGWARASCY